MTVGNNFTATGLNINIGNQNATAFYNFGTGALASGQTRAIGIGTNALAGSTNNITIGSAAGTSTTTLQGTTNGVTEAVDTNNTELATTAFVVGQAGSATPIVDGTATVGTSLRYARQDHVHPTDTSRAALASPTFTGTPLSTTAAVDTNTTQIATTAFVVAQAAAATPLVDGTAAVGTSLRYARQDHVHPTDTSRAPTASPTFTGTVTVNAPANFSAGSKLSVANNASSAGLNVGATATVPSGPSAGDIFTSSVSGHITGYANSMYSAMTAVRAWVNFNGTGTVAIRAGYNVSSITDNGVGDYTVNFTNAMVDANYTVSALSGLAGVTWGFSIPCGLTGRGGSNPYSTTQFRMATISPADVNTDNSFVNLVFLR
jgi:hypothetical protein